MADIVKLMKNQPDLYTMKGASDEDIKLAEEMLDLRFAADYREYVATFGVASFAGHELTGVCKSKRLDVVTVTQNERKINSTAYSDWYVVEDATIDGIVIWQSSQGEVYLCQGMCVPKKIADSLAEYLEL